MMIRMMLKVVLLSSVLCLAEEYTPEQKISFAEDGNVLDEYKKEKVIIGAQIYHSYGKQGYHKSIGYPEHLKHIYRNLPFYDAMRKAGLGSIEYVQSPLWMRRLLARFSQDSDPAGAYKNYSDFIEMYLNAPKTRMVWSLKDAEDHYRFLREIRMPVYVETNNGHSNILIRNYKLSEKMPGYENAFTHAVPNGFSANFQLGNEQGRNVLLAMWRSAALDIKRENAVALGYELFNETRYQNGSDLNRRYFMEFLQKKYGGIEDLNRVWGTDCQDFRQAAFENKGIPFHVEFGKFQQKQLADVCAEGLMELRKIDPDARISVQNLGGSLYRRIWTNVDLYQINRHCGLICKGTGNFTFASSAGCASEEVPYVEAPNPPVDFADMKFILAMADGKPVISPECYANRSYGKLHSILWHEIVSGNNIIYLFSWGGLWVNARQALEHPYAMLSRHVFDPGGFQAIIDVQREVSSVSDILLPRKNRPPAEVAFLYSYPTIRVDECTGNFRGIGMDKAARALEFAHFNFDCVLEEQMRDEQRHKRYKVLLLFGTGNLYPENAKNLETFVREGGVVFCGPDLPVFNEFARPLPNRLFDLKTTSASGSVVRLEPFGGKGHPVQSVHPPAHWKAIAFLGQKPALLKKQFGKGWVYYLSAELSDYTMANLLKKLLPEHGVKPMAEILKQDEKDYMQNVSVHKFRSGEFTLWYLMNYDDYPKTIVLRATELNGSVVQQIFDQKEIAVHGSQATVLLKPMKRRVLVSGKRDALEKRFGKFPILTDSALGMEKALLTGTRKETLKKVLDCRPLDLRTFANRGFDNRQNWENGTAWFDARSRDLKGVPWEEQIFGEVRFDLIRMDYNENKTCIALKSRNQPSAPSAVCGIPVKEYCRAINFLHAVTFGKPGETAMDYVIHYTDGSSLKLPVEVGTNIGDWTIASNDEDVQRMAAWRNPDGKGFFQWEWINPEPGKQIASVDLISRNGQSSPIVVAVSIRPVKKNIRVISLNDWQFTPGTKECKKRGNVMEVVNAFPLSKLTAPAGKPLELSADKLNTAVFRFSVTSKPDKWGSRKKAAGTCVVLTGMKNGKRTGSPGRAWQGSANHTGNYTVFDDDPATWQEVVLPLKIIWDTNMAPGEKIHSITGIQLKSQSKVSPQLIRDFRIEYEEKE